MRALATLALLLAASLAGCADPEPSVQPPLSCLARFVGEPAANAALIAALQDDPEAIAQRVAQVAGDNLSGPPVDRNGTLRFPTERGFVEYARAGEAGSGRLTILWSGEPAWPPPPRGAANGTAPDATEASSANGTSDPDVSKNATEAQIVTRLLDALAFPGDAVHLPVGEGRAFVQIFEGEAIVGTGGVVQADGLLRVGPLYELRVAEERLAADRAEEIAREFAACEMGGEASVERGGWVVRRDSLSIAFRIEREGACAAVAVDAETGAVHEAAQAGCA